MTRAPTLTARKVLRVMGVDTALRCTGLGIVESDGGRMKAIQYGVIRNKKDLSVVNCLGRIAGGIEEFIDEYEPNAISIEGVFYCRNVSTAVRLGEARGAVLCVAAKRTMEVFEYSPRKIKQAVVGFGGADKEQVRRMIMSLLSLNEQPPYDASDALAAAICHVHGSRLTGRSSRLS